MTNTNLHPNLEQHSSTSKYREAAVPATYEHQEFPKLVYKEGNHKSVANTQEETAALADGFSLKPEPPKPAGEAVHVPAETVTLPERTVTAPVEPAPEQSHDTSASNQPGPASVPDVDYSSSAAHQAEASSVSEGVHPLAPVDSSAPHHVAVEEGK